MNNKKDLLMIKKYFKISFVLLALFGTSSNLLQSINYTKEDIPSKKSLSLGLELSLGLDM